MVRLKNIRKNENDNIIECDIIPEDSTESGWVKVDLKSYEIINYKLPKGYEYCRNHVAHARKRLKELSKLDNLPENDLVMWY